MEINVKIVINQKKKKKKKKTRNMNIKNVFIDVIIVKAVKIYV